MIAKSKRKGRIQATIGKAAVALGVSNRTLGDWFSRGCPGRPGCYDLDEIEAWRSANIAEPRGGRERQASSGEGTLQEQKLRSEIAKLDEEVLLKQLKRKLFEGELMRRDDVLQQLSELVLYIKSQIEAIPDQMEMEFPAETRAENRSRLDALLRMLLWKLSEFTMQTEQG